jgi:hypothetical protein
MRSPEAVKTFLAIYDSVEQAGYLCCPMLYAKKSHDMMIITLTFQLKKGIQRSYPL